MFWWSGGSLLKLCSSYWQLPLPLVTSCLDHASTIICCHLCGAFVVWALSLWKPEIGISHLRVGHFISIQSMGIGVLRSDERDRTSNSWWASFFALKSAVLKSTQLLFCTPRASKASSLQGLTWGKYSRQISNIVPLSFLSFSYFFGVYLPLSLNRKDLFLHKLLCWSVEGKKSQKNL